MYYSYIRLYIYSLPSPIEYNSAIMLVFIVFPAPRTMLIHRGYVTHICWLNSVFQIQFDFFFTYLYTVVFWEKSNILPENSVNSVFHFDLSHQKRSLFSEKDYWIELKLWITIQFRSFCIEISWKLFKVLSLPIKKPFTSLEPAYKFRKAFLVMEAFPSCSAWFLSMHNLPSAGDTIYPNSTPQSAKPCQDAH